MAELSSITEYFHRELQLDCYVDASLNGLQVEGTNNVTKIAAAVDGAFETVEQAHAANAQLLVVHHGLFWKEPLPIIGATRRLVSSLLEAQISLFAAHLPLDGGERYGNNYLLAAFLGLENKAPFLEYSGRLIGCKAENLQKLDLCELSKKLTTLPGSSPEALTLAFGPDKPERIGIVSGAGADALYCCEAENIDTIITGEPRQFAYHYAKERGLNAIFAGHYATETLGVQAIVRAAAEEFNCEWCFLDCPTGI